MREDAYSLDTDELSAVVDGLGQSHEVLSRLADDLEARVSQLHLTWDGQAAQAHRAAQSAWSEGYGEMREALARMRTAADAAHLNYTAAAAVNRDMWEQVR